MENFQTYQDNTIKMIKKLTYILIYFVIILPLHSYERDTIGILHITNINLLSADTLEFDINLENTGEWQRAVNGTFYLRVDGSNSFNPDINPLKIDYIPGSSQLNMGPITGPYVLPSSDYNIYQEAKRDTLMITLVGPRDYGNCTVVNTGEKVRIGSFQLTTMNPIVDSTMIPEKIYWLQPYDFFQAASYKLERDSSVFGIPRYENDNIEIDDWCHTAIRYISDSGSEPCMIADLDGYYIGSRRVKLTWISQCESYCRGYVLKRAIQPFGTSDRSLLKFDTTIARYDWPRPEDRALTGLGTRTPGRAYEYIDEVHTRGYEYCYELSYVNFTYEEKPLDTFCLPIPNAVITYAQPNPNPFEYATTVKYRVDDDVMLRCDVFDVQGKKVMNLINDYEDGEYTAIGWHEVRFVAPQLASQGLYSIIFIAYPIDDPTVELSRAFVKVQLIK